MPPRGGSTAITPTRLPPLPKLRVRRPNKFEDNPCMSVMSSVLGQSPQSERWGVGHRC